ncbi:MAG: CvpA family protein [Alicyclobacillaceae bacterium]|nr:CvpA family protein [Alicyclobacillaceae bacterium]
MDLLDLIIVAVVALGGWNGYRTGLIRQVTRLCGTIIAYLLSMWLRPYVAPVVRDLHLFPAPQAGGPFDSMLGDLSDAVAFAGVFIVTFVLLRYAAGLVDALFSLPVLSSLNRLAGLVAGLALTGVFVYVVTLVLQYVNNPRLQQALEQSAIVQWLDANRSHWNVALPGSKSPEGPDNRSRSVDNASPKTKPIL